MSPHAAGSRASWRAARRPRPAGFVWAAVLLSSAGCRGCRSKGTHRGAAKPAPSASAPLLPHVHAARFAPPAFHAEANLRDVGLPTGCRIQPPLRVADLPGGKLRFVAVAGTLDRLALAAGGGGRAPARRGLVDLHQEKSADLPWSVLDAPPALAMSSRGPVGALARPAAGTLSRAVLWRPWSSPESLVQGDRLQVADLACAGNRCALLTSLARKAAAPGATLLIGGVDAPARAWKRIDIEADSAVALSPWSLSRFDPAAQSGWVTLAAANEAELWRVTHGRATKKSRIETPFGLYDVAPSDEPVLITPGEDPHAACKVDRFPLVIRKAGEKPRTVVLRTHPSSVIAKAMGRGALVMWVGPTTCGASTSVVGSLLLDAEGHPVGSPMAVREATGFALATHGDSLSLWLRTAKGLEWARAKCQPTHKPAGSP